MYNREWRKYAFLRIAQKGTRFKSRDAMWMAIMKESRRLRRRIVADSTEKHGLDDLRRLGYAERLVLMRKEGLLTTDGHQMTITDKGRALLKEFKKTADIVFDKQARGISNRAKQEKPALPAKPDYCYEDDRLLRS